MKIKRLFIFVIILILLGILAYYWPQITGKTVVNNDKADYEKETVFAIRVIDGDTIETDLGNIRLLGLNNKKLE